MESQYLEGEVLEEGHEEWLSEGVLTDDDQNVADGDAAMSMSQDMTASIESTDQEISQDMVQMEYDGNQGNQVIYEYVEAEGEQEMQSGEGSHEVKPGKETQEILAEVINQNMQDGQEIQETQDGEAQEMQSGEVTQEVKGGENMVQGLEQTRNIEDTLNSLENAEESQTYTEELPGDLNTFLVRKSEPRQRAPSKESDLDQSVKQEDDDGNDTDDLLRMLGEGDEKAKQSQNTVDNNRGDLSDDDEYIFHGGKVTTLQVAKNALIRRPATIAQPEDDESSDASYEAPKRQTKEAAKSEPRVTSLQHPKKITKHVVSVVQRPPTTQIGKKILNSTPLRQYRNNRLVQRTSLLKTQNVNQVDAKKVPQVQQPPVCNRVPKPEQMDEEPPSDFESDDGDESLYDELPSSESDDEEEWFTLDVRAERASDYIPMLGDQAHKLLSEEKQRVSKKLSALKQSLTALTDNSKRQAEDLRKATLAVAQLDAMLKAA